MSPAERTVGQLIADSIRLYGRTFWRGILIAIPATAFTVGAAFIDGTAGLVYGLVVGPLALGLSFVWASVVATGGRNAPGRALLAGAIAFLPLAASRVVVFAGIYFVTLAWFALVGLGYRQCSSRTVGSVPLFAAVSSSRARTSGTRSGRSPPWRSSSSSRSSRSRCSSPVSARRASPSRRCSRSSSCRRSSSWGAGSSISTRKPG